MQAAEILRLVSGALQDLEPGIDSRWKWTGGADDAVGLLDFLNAAIRTIVMLRPDATAITESIRLEPGMRQRIPSRTLHEASRDALTLIDVTRNMGSDGRTPGGGILPITPEMIRGMGCNGISTARSIDNYGYDRLVDRLVYYVFPAVEPGASVWVEATYSATPPPVSTEADALPIPDTFQSALVHGVLYGVFSGDNEASNLQRATHHYEAMLKELEMKTATDRGWPVNAPQVRGGAPS